MKKILIGFALISLILLVGCSQEYNPDISVCNGVYWEYDTYLKGEGNKIVYQYSHECAERLTNNEVSDCPLIKSSTYWKDGRLYSCEVGTWNEK